MGASLALIELINAAHHTALVIIPRSSLRGAERRGNPSLPTASLAATRNDDTLI
jgi:hypothetical protein